MTVFGEPPVLDYSNIFGAGIGFDLNNPGLNTGASMKLPFDAATRMVIGVSFDLDEVPATGLRVEFPFGTTATPAGVWRPSPSVEHAAFAGHALSGARRRPDGFVRARRLFVARPHDTYMSACHAHEAIRTTRTLVRTAVRTRLNETSNRARSSPRCYFGKTR